MKTYLLTITVFLCWSATVSGASFFVDRKETQAVHHQDDASLISWMLLSEIYAHRLNSFDASRKLWLARYLKELCPEQMSADDLLVEVKNYKDSKTREVADFSAPEFIRMPIELEIRSYDTARGGFSIRNLLKGSRTAIPYSRTCEGISNRSQTNRQFDLTLEIVSDPSFYPAISISETTLDTLGVDFSLGRVPAELYLTLRGLTGEPAEGELRRVEFMPIGIVAFADSERRTVIAKLGQIADDFQLAAESEPQPSTKSSGVDDEPVDLADSVTETEEPVIYQLRQTVPRVGSKTLYRARARSNVRTGPGASNRVAGTLLENEMVAVTGQDTSLSGQVWYKIKTSGGLQGYVLSRLLEPQR